MIAGPNGAGKTTLTRWLSAQGVDFGEYINPDDIAARLTGSYEARVLEAQGTADRRREDCLTERRSFTFETVMSHPSKVDLLVRARSVGFFTQMYFVGTDDPRTNIERVALRVSKGGHDVPLDRIVPRWNRTMELLHRAIDACDKALIFDNSEILRLVAEITDRLTARTFGPTPDWVQHFVIDRVKFAHVDIC
jgi:predicted ABC-type ATPase